MLVDKPAGVTSHDVVAQLRRELSAAHGRRVKVGHSGTLDPFATGLLVMLVGRATRLQRYLHQQSKIYLATARLGWRSSSGDSDGELTETGRIPHDPQLPQGEVDLPVPRLSAVKVDGERLYAKARRGEEFEPPTRTMTVYRARRMSLNDETALFEIDCAGGTYVRSLVATLEDAYCQELRRTRVGALSVEQADPARLLDPLAAVDHLPQRELSDEEARTLIHGRVLEVGESCDGQLALICQGRLLGVGVASDAGLRSETILAGSLEELLAR